MVVRSHVSGVFNTVTKVVGLQMQVLYQSLREVTTIGLGPAAARPYWPQIPLSSPASDGRQHAKLHEETWVAETQIQGDHKPYRLASAKPYEVRAGKRAYVYAI